jgi:hypothetical protein
MDPISVGQLQEGDACIRCLQVPTGHGSWVAGRDPVMSPPSSASWCGPDIEVDMRAATSDLPYVSLAVVTLQGVGGWPTESKVAGLQACSCKPWHVPVRQQLSCWRSHVDATF